MFGRPIKRPHTDSSLDSYHLLLFELVDLLGAEAEPHAQEKPIVILLFEISAGLFELLRRDGIGLVTAPAAFGEIRVEQPRFLFPAGLRNFCEGLAQLPGKKLAPHVCEDEDLSYVGKTKSVAMKVIVESGVFIKPMHGIELNLN